ncbi:hypothetical protein MUY27_01675 [Mucilaginibacter sp. RS28]|uniref:Uncharacterized protein n=1 Tax=Mucilaginibacter straminoryzae TaxID=2932774 RepID=A0A9X1X4G4_9SPHI|nr:hypothetical protein [Mucilaginibacter straminoryzae]MCJ8208399.1 hypothetical protein [Mucilaginibacter straminoryzae]
MKKNFLIRCIAVVLLFTFVAGQLAVSLHTHHHASYTKADHDQSRKENDTCNICHFSSDPVYFSCQSYQAIRLAVSSYHYLTKNTLFKHEVVIYQKCGRAPPVMA